VVAQTLDYVSSLAAWSYADLRERVAAAIGYKGNIPYEVAQSRGGSKLSETKFAEVAAQSLREGRFLVLLVGDGLREGVRSLTELVSRPATKAFSFGLVEVALFKFVGKQIAVLPRVLARPEVIVRHATVINMRDGAMVVEETDGAPNKRKELTAGSKAHLRAWWEPILEMRFDDQEQEPPFWLATNNVVLNTPFPGIQIKALAIVGSAQIGIFMSGPRVENMKLIEGHLKRERQSLLRELPDGTEIRAGDKWPITLMKFDIPTDDKRRAWLMDNLNKFVSVLRPRLKSWYKEFRS